MDGYRLATHQEAGDREELIAGLSELNRLAFAQYQGVVRTTPDFLRWYLARPGMKPALCQAAYWECRLVSNVFVTLVPMVLGGEVRQCGIIDTVMTHPEHRRRGLAKQLMARAAEAMEAAGAEVSLLYTARTQPLSGPEQLYRSLGYRPRELVAQWERPAGPIPARPASPVAPEAAARQSLEKALGSRDGWLPLDDALWRWRREARPRPYPVSLYAAGETMAAICVGALTSEEGPRLAAVMSDLALSQAETAGEELGSVLAAAPAGAPIITHCAESDGRLGRLLKGLGFAGTGTEVAMLRPISAGGSSAAEASSARWYIAVESLVGV